MTGLANEIDLAVQLAPPPVADDEGIALVVHHLEFVGLGAQAVADWRARRSPLGMSPALYRDFCETFFAAGQTDGVPDPDARLKGSAAIIFSGRHKALPESWGEHLAMFAQAHGQRPTPAQEDDLRDRFERFWRHRSVPRRRPFDCMFELNLDTHRSDYDIQVSSAEIERRCSTILAANPRLAPHLHHPRYGFLDDVLSVLRCQPSRGGQTGGRRHSVVRSRSRPLVSAALAIRRRVPVICPLIFERRIG